MSGKTSKSNISSTKTVATTVTASSNTIHPRQRIMQNFLLILVDAEIDQSNKDCQNTLVKLQNVVDDVRIFTTRDECIDFLTEVDCMKAFLIIEGTLGQQILPLIHNIPQLHGVYVLDSNKSSLEQWAKKWVKVKGIYTEITPICESFQQTIKQVNQDSIAMSFITSEEAASSQNLDQMEPSFMYTKLFKEILLKMEDNQQSIKYLTAYCRSGDYGSPTNITRFENDYKANKAIWWYTFPSFIYSMLNEALRMLKADIIVNMGFFIRDLHHQIEELHQKQVSSYRGKSFVVYRGQGLSTTDFEKLRNTKGGLMSFNNFLSTSKTREVSLGFAIGALSQTDTVGILFQMSIDPSVSSAPFASIDELSYFHTEEEILFSMHTVFRIGDIKQINENNPLYQVELTLASDDDPQLRILTQRIREEAGGGTGWQTIGTLLIKINQLDKAEELYTVLLEQTSDEGEKAHYYNQLGCIKNHPSDSEKALSFYRKSLEIYQTLSPNHPGLAALYNNIGSMYDNMGEYSKALSFYKKSLEIFEKTLPPNHPGLAISYSNIGSMYDNMGEYSKALSFYKKSLEICQKTLSPNHLDLAASYNNIGLVYDNMGEYSKALSFLEKSLGFRQKSLPPNHPGLATSFNNIGLVYNNMEEYPKALSFYEKSLAILEKSLPPAHPSLAASYNNIACLFTKMENYSKALSYFQRALDIQQDCLPPNHPHIQSVREKIEFVKRRL